MHLDCPVHSFLVRVEELLDSIRGMALVKLLSLLTLLFGATASALKAREPAPHPLDVRQLESNQCANIEVSLLDYGIAADISGSILHGISSIAVPDQVSQLPAFVCRTSRVSFLLTQPPLRRSRISERQRLPAF
jgi:hypothetical protein